MPPLRHLTDPAHLKAFAHPTRLRLLDVLRADGPATVGQLSERLDEAVGSVSHHLKILAAAELVELAPELARDRRETWWRASRGSAGWDRRQLDPVAAAVGQAAEEAQLLHQTELFRSAIHEPLTKGEHRGFATNTWLTLDDDELEELEREVTSVVARYIERTRNRATTANRRPVLFVARAARVRP